MRILFIVLKSQFLFCFFFSFNWQDSLVKCPADAIYVQVLAQSQTDNYFTNNQNANSVHVNLIEDANDSYKQLLLSVGK